MRLPARFVAIALLVAVFAASGCRLFDEQPKGKLSLGTLQPAEDAVALEIFFAHFDYGFGPYSQRLWEQVDEQVLPVETRRELARYGFRVGLVGSQVPVDLAHLMTLTDRPQPKTAETKVDLENEPLVKLRILEIRSGRKGEIIASPHYDRLPLLWREGDKVMGRPYDNADGRFVLKATKQSDGRVELDLQPELHYGKAEQRWVADDGVFRLASAAKKRIFKELHVNVDLAPGQMLLMTCRPDHPGSVGHYFFTEPVADESLAQRMVIIRLAQAGSDRAFSEIVSAEIDPATGQPVDAPHAVDSSVELPKSDRLSEK